MKLSKFKTKQPGSRAQRVSQKCSLWDWCLYSPILKMRKLSLRHSFRVSNKLQTHDFLLSTPALLNMMGDFRTRKFASAETHVFLESDLWSCGLYLPSLGSVLLSQGSPTLLLSWLKGRESVMGSRRYFHFRFMRSWIKSPKKQINHKKLFFLLIKKYYLWWL